MSDPIFDSIKSFLREEKDVETDYGDKEYLGKTARDEHLYLVGIGEDYAILDALGEELMSTKEEDSIDGLNMQVDKDGEESEEDVDLKAFLDTAISKLQIEFVDSSIVDKYMTEEEEIIQEEPMIDGPEPVLPSEPVEPPEPDFDPITKEDDGEGEDEEELTVDDDDDEELTVDDEELKKD